MAVSGCPYPQGDIKTILTAQRGGTMRAPSILLGLPVCSILLSAASVDAPPVERHEPHWIRPLGYVESSNGLEVPGFESGRSEIELGDVNGDGHVDIVSIGDHGNPRVNSNQEGLMIWFGNGRGSWFHFQTGHFGYGGVSLGDVDGDGDTDVGYGMHHDYSGNDFGDQLLEVALNDGTGLNWTPWDDGLATNGESWGMFCTDFADVDNDGDLDIGANSFGCCSGLHVYRNQGDGTWVQSWGFVSGNSRMDFIFGDVNGDGNADLAAAHGDGMVYIGDGLGGFMLADANLPVGNNIPDLGDIDNDGADEVAWCSGAGGVEVWMLRPSGQWVDVSGNLPDSGPWEMAQIADMDMDGIRDIIAYGERICTVWKGSGSGGWGKIAEFDIGRNPGYATSFRAGVDADHNGFPDIVIMEEEGSFFNERNHLLFYKENSTARRLRIRGTYPTGGETWVIGSVRFVDWVSAVPAGETGTVDLELSVDGPDGPWTTIAVALPNSGRHQWTVDAPGPSSDAHFRFTVTIDGDAASFITPRPIALIE
jgi:hypothetical protein